MTKVISSTRPVVGPLTTVFTPPPGCFDVYKGAIPNILTQGVSCSSSFWAEGLRSETDTYLKPNENCFPPGRVLDEQIDMVTGLLPYSPGLFCPSGYTTACSSAILPKGLPPATTTDSSFAFSPNLLSGETAAACCPRGFSCVPNINILGPNAQGGCILAPSTGSISVTNCGEGQPTTISPNFKTIGTETITGTKTTWTEQEHIQ
ncbi:hypothetical protein EV356DRAFT_102841 [Viridothelium virens]|uniref:Uncharacterized protein n=1 Tax=Viridothelium virens TaxID=1048519 RepID=A0A6A6HQ07_VIRVR|nr:hypothetical protein EV356DRAFT_102841 [Viridothelium virens]